MSLRDDDLLDDATLRALRAADDLIPTSEAEVGRAEALLPDDLELPEGLRLYQPPARQTDNVRPLNERRGSKLGYAGAAVVGAAAAAAAAFSLRPSAPSTPVTSAGGELTKPRPSSERPARIPLVLGNRCERECCAGSDCKTAAPALSSCPSGIRCAGCTPDNVNGGPHRLRLGSMIPTEVGEKQLPLTEPLELCVSGPSGSAACVPALGEPGGASWRLLPVVTPLQDMLTGLELALRKRGDAQILARWKHPFSPTADVLCKGLAIQLSDGDEVLGKLSVFVESTHFVELGRAAAVPELLTAAERFDVSGTRSRIFETSRSGAERFALVLGPFEKVEAEGLRWQVLDHGREAIVSHGLDYVGTPRPTR
jgi:hypothetical protein